MDRDEKHKRRLIHEEEFLEAIEVNTRDGVEKICESCGRKINIFEDNYERSRFGGYYCITCYEEIYDAKLKRACEVVNKEISEIEKRYKEIRDKLWEQYKRGEISKEEFDRRYEELLEDEDEDYRDTFRHIPL